MLPIAWQTLRSRRASLAGAFVAIWLAVTLAYAAGLLMTGALSAPGPGRYDAADAVVRADPAVQLGGDLGGVDVLPAPRLGADLVERAAAVPGVARAVGDVAFPAGLRDAHGAAVGEHVHGHDWSGAVLTPFVLDAGAAPAGPRDVVAEARLGLRVGDRVRVTTAAGGGAFRVSGIAHAAPGADPDQAALFFSSARARALSGAPGHVTAIGVLAADGVAPAALQARLGAALGGGVEVLDRAHAADADPGSPLAGDREQLIAMFGTLAGIAGVVALFVVAGTFALAIAQRRRETAVLRALGATPRQVRRLIAAEALLVSAVATALGVAAGAPLAQQIVDVLADHGTVPRGFAPVGSWIPLAGARRHGPRHRPAGRRRRRAAGGPDGPGRGAARGRDRACPPRRAPAPRGRPEPGRGRDARARLLRHLGAGVRRARRHAAGGRRRAARPADARRAGRDRGLAAARARRRRACSRAPAWRPTAGARRRSPRRSCSSRCSPARRGSSSTAISATRSARRPRG